MSGFSITVSNVLLYLLYLFPGWLLCRAKLAKPEHMSSASAILLYICGPCMFLNALTDLNASPALTARMGLFLLISLGAELLMMLLILLILGKKRSMFRYRMLSIASVMGNVAFFGLPIVKALFPEAPEAPVYSCIFCVSLNIVGWTMGAFTLTSDRKYISLKAAFLNPTVISVLAGFVLYLTGAKYLLPSLFLNGFKTVGGISTPLSLLILGIRLATMTPKELFVHRTIWLIMGLKLLVFPLFCWGITLLFPLDPVFRSAMLILGATPCAGIILNLAEMHGNGQEMAANCALLSTLLSILTIPLLSLLI